MFCGIKSAADTSKDMLACFIWTFYDAYCGKFYQAAVQLNGRELSLRDRCPYSPRNAGIYHLRPFIGGGGNLFLARWVTRLLPKEQFTGGRTKVHRYQVTIAYLFGSDQVSQRLNKQPVDSPFQMPGTVSCVCPFLEQVSLAGCGNMQLERAAWRGLK